MNASLFPLGISLHRHRLLLVTLSALGFICVPPTVTAQKGAEKTAPPPVLSGRIVDDTGAPVTDAELTLSGPSYLKTTTDEDGYYKFTEVKKKGEYRVSIESTAWVSLKDYRKLERFELTPTSQVTRNFTMDQAARFEVRAVDEEGVPIRGVRVYVASLAADRYRNSDSFRTDVDGVAVVGGLKPSTVKYILGFWHDGYAFAKLTASVKKAGIGESLTVTMKKGLSLKGTSVCSDGKPPVGWRILAMPDWWHFGSYPQGFEIGKDGTFEFSHIVPGEYQVTISIPQGDGSSRTVPVMTDDLLSLPQPLSIKINQLSPASMTSISGTVTFEGKRTRGVWFNARSNDGKHNGSVFVRPKDTEFKIVQLPPGLYNITASATDIAPIDLKNVKAPTADLKVVLRSRGKPTIAGSVFLPDGKTPVKQFKLSVLKLRTLSGPNYVEDARWKSVDSPDGSYSAEVNSPGIYIVTALADGFAPSSSKNVNTTEQKFERTNIVLDKGVKLSGTVIDDDGQPVAGALVQPMSTAGRSERGPSQEFLSKERSVVTDADGHFVLPHLPRGKEQLLVSRTGYCFTKVGDLDLDERAETPLKITLQKGGTIRGLVFDGNGEPVSGRVLHFQDSFHGSDYERGSLATAATDSRGFYQVHQLPIQTVHITCGDEWRGTGVARRTVLPRNGERLTVYFGGTEKLTGTLKVNGAPLANTRLQLGGDSPFSSIMKSFTNTDADGNFTFYGTPPGIWTLYYSIGIRSTEQVAVRQVEVAPDADFDLGIVDHTSGSLTINCITADPTALKELRLSLVTYDPVWTRHQSIGVQRPRKDSTDPFVFDQIPTGDFELLCYRQNHVSVRHRLKVSANMLNQTIDVRLPGKTTTLIGRVSREVIKGRGGLNIWSEDGRWETAVRLDEEGKFRVKNLPLGNWLVRVGSTRTAPPIFEFQVTDTREKIIEFTEDNAKRPTEPNGYAAIETFVAPGVLTSCRVTLKGPNGEIRARSQQRGRVSFSAPTGEYEATISLKGFATQKRKVMLIPPNDEGRMTDDWKTKVMLERN